MQLERPTTQTPAWDGTVPSALDYRVLALVVGLAGLAASLNVPYGGLPFALAAFAALVCGGVGCHLLGERRLRGLTDDLLAEWTDRGGHIESVTRSARGFRTEWTVHTAAGDLTIGGLPFAPISRLSVTRDGIGEAVAVTDAHDELEYLADQWYREFLEH